MSAALRATAWALPLFLTVVGGEPPTETVPAPLRIGVATRAREVRITCSTEFVVELSADRLTLSGDSVVVFRPVGRHSIAVVLPDGSRRYAGHGVRITSAGEPLAYLRLVKVGPPERRSYRGTFAVVVDAAYKLSLVNIIDADAYLRGVVGKEMNPDYPAEALKAQAIAARTYAFRSRRRHRADGFDLCATEHCQVYGGLNAETPSTLDAVASTQGEVLWHDGAPALALYSSTCGGFTEDIEQVYGGEPIPYLRSVPCFEPDDSLGVVPPDGEDGLSEWLRSTPRVHCLQPRLGRYEVFRWVVVRERAALEAALREWGLRGELMGFTVVRRGRSGRIGHLTARGSVRDAGLETEAAIRTALGLRSSAFVFEAFPQVSAPATVYVFWGGGWGHGVGMCQMGAVGLALEGWEYRAILQKYYRGVELRTLYYHGDDGHHPGGPGEGDG